MFCPNCGNQVPEDAKFCPNCGAGLEPVKNGDARSQGGQTTEEVRENAEDTGRKNKQLMIQAGAAFVGLQSGIIVIDLLINDTSKLIEFIDKEDPEGFFMFILYFMPTYIGTWLILTGLRMKK